jgi:hypothetical protein
MEIFNADRIEVIKPKPVPQAKKTKTSGDRVVRSAVKALGSEARLSDLPRQAL